MDAQTINQTYDLLSLVERDTKLKHSGKFYIGPCPFCGGRDRFNLKQTAEGWRWFCRKCGDDKYHGTVDYIMRRDNLDFKQALESLGGQVQAGPREMVRPVEPEITVPDQAWQDSKWEEVSKAAHMLFNSPQAEHAQEYLQSRGLDYATWNIYLLGFAFVFNRPAIVIPWCDMGPQSQIITAIKYRFIDDRARDPDYRYMMAPGSKPILFGLNAAALSNVLVLVEGEINAMSITQASARDLLKIDALSFGGETGSRDHVVQRAAEGYARVVIWADSAEKAKAIRSSLDRPADVLCSPEIENVKYDANALLQKDWLSDFLRQAIYPSTFAQRSILGLSVS